MEVTAKTVLKLQFGHDCRNVGCNTPGCALCRNNPNRRCRSHFREKYVDNANRVFAAHCSAPILVRLVDSQSEEPFEVDSLSQRLHDSSVQLCLLEGNSYDQKVQELGTENLGDEDLAQMLLLDNSSGNTVEPLLVAGKGCTGTHSPDNRLIVPLLVEGTPILVRTSRSSQSAQGGRTRPFRLLARVLDPDGQLVHHILPAVSEPFVVTTRRTQAAEKALIPRWDDSVSKLPGVGKETFNKLKNLKSAGLQTPLVTHRIDTVGQLHELLESAGDSLLMDLGQTLGVKNDKILELRDAARNVAREDNRKRVWGDPSFPSERLLYPCRGGAVNLVQEHIEVMRDTEDGVEIIDTADLPAEDLVQVLQMREVAFHCWWETGHPGWGVIDTETEVSEQQLPERGTLSLRQQMARQCKQRRIHEPYEDGSSPSGSGNGRNAYSYPVSLGTSEGLAAGYDKGGLGIGLPAQAQHAPVGATSTVQTKHELDDYNSVCLPEHCMPGRSVFDLDVYPEEGEDPLALAARELVGQSKNLKDATSSGVLLDQPVGLANLQEPSGEAGFAYISAGPTFQRSGPIRFKRTVSGNRYKNVPHDGAATESNSINFITSPEGSLVLTPALPPLGMFSGLQPKVSRELRSQTSLDKVANWQQTRPLSFGSTLGNHLSFSLSNLGLGLLDDLEYVNPDFSFA